MLYQPLHTKTAPMKLEEPLLLSLKMLFQGINNFEEIILTLVRQLFQVALQASIGAKIIARET